jgi:hypothetical protein
VADRFLEPPDDGNSLDVQEATQRYRGLTALIKAAASQLGSLGYLATGAVMYENAEVIADEITGQTLVNPGLALIADFAVNGMLQITADMAVPE